MDKIKYLFLLVLFTASLISSIILSFTPTSIICDINKGCEVVHYSRYNYTFGIQNSHYGIAAFALMIFLTLSHLKKPNKNKRILIYSGIVIGSIIAARFLYIQQFILGAYCKYCIVIDLSMLTALIIILTW